MAESQSHKLGEFIGTFFEDTFKVPIKKFAKKNNLFFDHYGERKARKSLKVRWKDIHGSEHDLDYVLERGGTSCKIGQPMAFIELAWRRYTKHSKNKVQEIAGAVNPIYEKYKIHNPFKGAILSGNFTKNSLTQLEKDNFYVLYIPFEKITSAFSTYGFDVSYDEDTPEAVLATKYKAVSNPSNKVLLEKIRKELLKLCKSEIEEFIGNLEISCQRTIKNIVILPLHGIRTEVQSIKQAIIFINNYTTLPTVPKLEYIEVIVNYYNGSIIQCQFKTKQEVIDFLNNIK